MAKIDLMFMKADKALAKKLGSNWGKPPKKKIEAKKTESKKTESKKTESKKATKK